LRTDLSLILLFYISQSTTEPVIIKYRQDKKVCFGEKLNISRHSISKWERGESYPSIELLIKLSDIFDITLDELVKEDHS